MSREEQGPWRLLRALFLPASLAVLVTAALVVPMPYFIETPGTPLDLSSKVEVSDAQGLNGDFLVTTVNLRQGTVAGLVTGLFDEHAVFIRSSRVLPPGEDDEAFFDRQRDIFRESVDVAAAVALDAAGYDVDPSDLTGSGAVVARILLGAPADGVLRPGDVITAVDGVPIEVSDDLRGLIGDAEHLELTVLRDGHELRLEVRPGPIETSEGRIRGIGIEVQTANPRIVLPVDVEVDSGEVGGPSAGLVLALTIYDLVADEDLAAGRVVAGTGTVSPQGNVGPIGGIARKVISAEQSGADVFVVPSDQLGSALAAQPQDSDMEVISAATFEEALADLRTAGALAQGADPGIL